LGVCTDIPHPIAMPLRLTNICCSVQQLLNPPLIVFIVIVVAVYFGKHGTNVTHCVCMWVLDGRCVPYSGSVCRHVFGTSSSVYVPAFVADAVAIADSIIQNQLSQLTPQCRNVTLGTLCRYAFPDCAGTVGIAKSKPLCR